MPVMCDDCKCSNWLCKECGEYSNDCGCECCKCTCQRQDSTSLDVHIDNQPTERSNTMNDTYEGPVVTADQQANVYLKEQVDALQKRIDLLSFDLATARVTIDEHRRKVTKLFTKVNDFIDENECDEESEINLGDLDDILNQCFNNHLVFEKLYEVQITYTVDATFEIRAKDEDAAREIAEDIGIDTDPRFDHDEDPTECVIDESRVHYIQRKVN